MPGHEGIRGNDAADAAAKDATNQVISPLSLPSTDYKRKINSYIRKKWQRKWDKKQANKLQSIQPTIGEGKHKAKLRS